MEPLEVLILLPLAVSNLPAVATTELRLYLQLLILLQNHEDLVIAGTASATGTIKSNDAAQL
jgi:hypothetical protein